MTLLVTGGTGSFGHAMVKAAQGPVRVLSRDEEKQRRMAMRYPAVEFVIGDVRDRDAVRRAMRDVTHVFHAAALKQVPSCEFNAMEAVKTNVLGTDNVCTAAAEVGAKVVVLSTDKAVEPVGVMGGTKFLAEAVARNHGVNVVRYGNVVGSRGSIIPLFRDLIAQGKPVTVTDPAMTRFLITLDEAIGLVWTAMDAPADGSVYVRKSPAATVAQIVRVLARDHPVQLIGPRPGEKKHEALVVGSECVEDLGDYFRVWPHGAPSGITYSSEMAHWLDDEALAAILAMAPTDDYA